MAHRGLALAQPLAQVGDVKLAVGRQGEIKQNAQASLVAQEFEDLSKFANGLIRHFGGRRGGCPFVPETRLVSFRAIDVNPRHLWEKTRETGSEPAVFTRFRDISHENHRPGSTGRSVWHSIVPDYNCERVAGDKCGNSIVPIRT